MFVAAEPFDYDAHVQDLVKLWNSLKREEVIEALDALPAMEAIIVAERFLKKLVDIDQRFMLGMIGAKAAKNRDAKLDQVQPGEKPQGVSPRDRGPRTLRGGQPPNPKGIKDEDPPVSGNSGSSPLPAFPANL